LLLKNKFNLKIFLFLILLSKILSAEENENLIKNKISDYLTKTVEFSSKFIQTNDEMLQEGKFYIKRNRLRIEYISPSKLIIIVKENNAMYYNVDLEEVQYFNPKNTIAEIFFNLFYDLSFLDEVEISLDKTHFTLTKEQKIDDEKNIIKIIFERSPLIMRKIEVTNSNGVTTFGITDQNYNPELDDKIFSLANPLLS
tara:strand:- start:107 stop:700 length:594 start_codon:yes stop_codon:yes gene_type:complete